MKAASSHHLDRVMQVKKYAKEHKVGNPEACKALGITHLAYLYAQRMSKGKRQKKPTKKVTRKYKPRMQIIESITPITPVQTGRLMVILGSPHDVLEAVRGAL